MRWEFKRLFKRAKENFGKAFSVLFDDVKNAANELFVQIPKDIKTFAKTLWTYKGILWSDRDYDHAFILYLLQMKIRRTKEYIGTHKRHTRWKLDVKNMQKAEDLIESILSGDHDKTLREAHDTKWGKAEYHFVKSSKFNGSVMRSLRENVHNPKDQAQEQREYRILMNRSIKLEEKAWHALWTHLDKHMRSWWD